MNFPLIESLCFLGCNLQQPPTQSPLFADGLNFWLGFHSKWGVPPNRLVCLFCTTAFIFDMVVILMVIVMKMTMMVMAMVMVMVVTMMVMMKAGVKVHF